MMSQLRDELIFWLNTFTTQANSIRFEMASCSIREELVARYPTCIDYTTISSPAVRAMPVATRLSYIHFKPRAITEDEEWEMVHVVEYREGRIAVYNYQGHTLFSYPNNNFNHRLRPKGMCICNNIVYVTSPMLNELFLFTAEGDLITLLRTTSRKE